MPHHVSNLKQLQDLQKSNYQSIFTLYHSLLPTLSSSVYHNNPKFFILTPTSDLANYLKLYYTNALYSPAFSYNSFYDKDLNLIFSAPDKTLDILYQHKNVPSPFNTDNIRVLIYRSKILVYYNSTNNKKHNILSILPDITSVSEPSYAENWNVCQFLLSVSASNFDIQSFALNTVEINLDYDDLTISIPPLVTNTIKEPNNMPLNSNSIDNSYTSKSKSSTTNSNSSKPLFNLDFGPCGDGVKMSMYGLAVKNNSDTWVSYDKTSGAIIDVDIFNFEAGNFAFKMPVALCAVQVGDMIIHNRTPVYVTSIGAETLSVIDVRAAEAKSILPVRNMFGFNFVTKVVCFFDMMGCGTPSPSPENPFGNMLLPLMLSQSGGDMSQNMGMMLALSMSGGFGGAAPQSPNNMMMPLLLMGMMDKDNKTSEMDTTTLMMLMMAGQGGMNFAPSPALTPSPATNETAPPSANVN